MAKTVYVHLGLHKTATGWLQRQFFPRLGLPVHRTRKVEKIAALAGAAGDEAIIVSHEGLGGRIGDDKAPGDSLRMFEATMAGLPEVPAKVKVLIGFREHADWLASAYAQRGKKSAVTPSAYLDTYSPDDLLWMRRVALLDGAGLDSFLFLYEEFRREPMALCEDLCRFLGVSPPDDAEALLSLRENPSPRTERGLRIARVGHAVARIVGGLPFVDAKRLRHAASDFGASFDEEEERVEIALGETQRKELYKDWQRLLTLIGERRGKDLSAYAERSEGA